MVLECSRGMIEPRIVLGTRTETSDSSEPVPSPCWVGYAVPHRSAAEYHQTGSQVEWNPYQHDEDMLAFCKAHGIQLQARTAVCLPGTTDHCR